MAILRKKSRANLAQLSLAVPPTPPPPPPPPSLPPQLPPLPAQLGLSPPSAHRRQRSHSFSGIPNSPSSSASGSSSGGGAGVTTDTASGLHIAPVRADSLPLDVLVAQPWRSREAWLALHHSPTTATATTASPSTSLSHSQSGRAPTSLGLNDSEPGWRSRGGGRGFFRTDSGPELVRRHQQDDNDMVNAMGDFVSRKPLTFDPSPSSRHVDSSFAPPARNLTLPGRKLDLDLPALSGSRSLRRSASSLDTSESPTTPALLTPMPTPGSLLPPLLPSTTGRASGLGPAPTALTVSHAGPAHHQTQTHSYGSTTGTPIPWSGQSRSQNRTASPGTSRRESASTDLSRRGSASTVDMSPDQSAGRPRPSPAARSVLHPANSTNVHAWSEDGHGQPRTPASVYDRRSSLPAQTLYNNCRPKMSTAAPPLTPVASEVIDFTNPLDEVVVDFSRSSPPPQPRRARGTIESPLTPPMPLRTPSYTPSAPSDATPESILMPLPEVIHEVIRSPSPSPSPCPAPTDSTSGNAAATNSGHGNSGFHHAHADVGQVDATTTTRHTPQSGPRSLDYWRSSNSYSTTTSRTSSVKRGSGAREGERAAAAVIKLEQNGAEWNVTNSSLRDEAVDPTGPLRDEGLIDPFGLGGLGGASGVRLLWDGAGAGAGAGARRLTPPVPLQGHDLGLQKRAAVQRLLSRSPCAPRDVVGRGGWI